MKFMVKQADHHSNFDGFGLKTKYVDYGDNITDEVIDPYDIYFCFAEMEINSLEELIQFVDKVGFPTIVEKIDKRLESTEISDKYNYLLTIYNDYLE